MRVSSRLSRALARWGASRDLVPVSECVSRDRVIDEKGLAWECLGRGFFRLIKRGRPVVGTRTPFLPSRWVIRVPWQNARLYG